MAKNKRNDLGKFFDIADQIRSGQTPSDADLSFYYHYAPEITEQNIEEYAAGAAMTKEDMENAVVEASRILQSSPKFKEQTLRIAESNENKDLSDKVSKGINLILAGTDIAASVNQIRASNTALKKSSKPGRPAVPQRDAMLEQALRSAQEQTFSQENALAPVKAQIQDQYQSDMANAQTASAGQTGAYGSYAQLAANRRNRAAMELAPVADQIKRQDQARVDNLLQARAGETQQMFQNQEGLYRQDLYQYNQDQQAAAELGSQGRSNLRNSLQNMGAQIAPQAVDYYTERKYRNLKNQISSSLGKDAADIAEKNQRYLDEMYYGKNPTLSAEQMYYGNGSRYA